MLSLAVPSGPLSRHYGTPSKITPNRQLDRSFEGAVNTITTAYQQDRPWKEVTATRNATRDTRCQLAFLTLDSITGKGAGSTAGKAPGAGTELVAPPLSSTRSFTGRAITPLLIDRGTLVVGRRNS